MASIVCRESFGQNARLPFSECDSHFVGHIVRSRANDFSEFVHFFLERERDANDAVPLMAAIMHVYNRNFICLYNNFGGTNFVWIARTSDKVDER